MSVPRYPYALSDLANKGAIAADGEAVRADHFNRLFREITVLESAIGLNPAGSLADLRTALATEMNGDGSFKREIICEDDPSGAEAGGRRYLDSQWQDLSVGTTDASFPLAIGYNLFDDPPVVLFTVQHTGTWIADGERRFLTGNEPWGTRVFLSQVDGTAPASGSIRVAWLAISQNLQVFDEERAWELPPVRTGS